MKKKKVIADLVLEGGQRLVDQPLTQAKHFYYSDNGLRFDFVSGESLNHDLLDMLPTNIVMHTIKDVRNHTHYRFTHCARIKPVRRGGIPTLRLRETPMHWIDEKGRLYNKSKGNGFSTCDQFRIIFDSIRPLDPSGAIPKETHK